NDEEIHARVLVDATGRAAAVARRLGARRLCHDRLVCAYAVLDGERAEDGRSLVESCRDGWWYATPLPGGRALAGFFTDAPTSRAPLGRGGGVRDHPPPGGPPRRAGRLRANRPGALHRIPRAAARLLRAGDALAGLAVLGDALQCV